MKVKQLIRDIANIASSGSNPIEFKIEDSQILFWCNEIRSMLISQAIQKRQDISDIWIQTINCLELMQVDGSECCDQTSGCYVLRSVNKIPRTVEINGDNTILRVTTIKGNVIPKSNVFEYKYTKYAKYSKISRRWYIKNDYLYIENDAFLKYVNIDLLAENPADLINYNDCSNDACFTMDSDYPCSLKMANDITNIVLKTKVYPFLTMVSDNKNDSSNESAVQPNTKNL